jgi:hypothetical protein
MSGDIKHKKTLDVFIIDETSPSVNVIQEYFGVGKIYVVGKNATYRVTKFADLITHIPLGSFLTLRQRRSVRKFPNASPEAFRQEVS